MLTGRERTHAATRLCMYSEPFCCWSALLELFLVSPVYSSGLHLTLYFVLGAVPYFPDLCKWRVISRHLQGERSEHLCQASYRRHVCSSAFIDKFLMEGHGFKGNLWPPEIMCGMEACLQFSCDFRKVNRVKGKRVRTHCSKQYSVAV